MQTLRHTTYARRLCAALLCFPHLLTHKHLFTHVQAHNAHSTVGRHRHRYHACTPSQLSHCAVLWCCGGGPENKYKHSPPCNHNIHQLCTRHKHPTAFGFRLSMRRISSSHVRPGQASPISIQTDHTEITMPRQVNRVNRVTVAARFAVAFLLCVAFSKVKGLGGQAKGQSYMRRPQR